MNIKTSVSQAFAIAEGCTDNIQFWVKMAYKKLFRLPSSSPLNRISVRVASLPSLGR